MTQGGELTALLTEWWHGVSFPGKENCELQETGELILFPSEKGKERIVAKLHAENPDAQITSLVAQFEVVKEKLAALKSEWEQVEEKMDLAGKVARFREFLSGVNALGDYVPLWSQLESWEAVLDELSKEAYKARLAIVEEAEKWADSEEWTEATAFFKEVKNQWKQFRTTSKRQTEELWKRLEAACDKFYARKREDIEDREEDMLVNLDLKLELTEKAEALAHSDQWKAATEEFKQLMEKWKGTGRTLPGKNEELWQRFITAKNVFFDRKKQHYEQVQQEQESNYMAKMALVEQAESLKDSTDWSKTSKIFLDLTEKWKEIGKVPAEKLEEIRGRFFAAKDTFFNARRAHFDRVMSELEENYRKKLALLEQAEAYRNSTHWQTATEELNRLMNEWKLIGPVPRKYGDQIWKQFLDIRTSFFKRKDENRKLRKEQAQHHQERRRQQAAQYITTLWEELREEEEKLADFRNGLENITPGPKEEELRTHLTGLIEQTEKNIERKRKKVEELQNQLEPEAREAQSE